MKPNSQIFILPKDWLNTVLTLLFVLLSMLQIAEAQSANSYDPPPEEPALSVNEPIYFVVGKNDDVKARFQFSFKYRMFAEDGPVVDYAPWLKHFHFAYTQTSLWNLSDESAPFEDSSYRPSFFFDIERSHELDILPAFVRTGMEHESNGQAGDASRSINTVFVWPFWGGNFKGRDWFIAPKIIAYLNEGQENSDIAKYRGNSEVYFQYGNDDEWLIAAKVRPGRFNHPAYQLEVSWPIRKQIFFRTGGFLFIQYFNGYGESLLNYNQRSGAQIRIGFSIVR